MIHTIGIGVWCHVIVMTELYCGTVCPESRVKKSVTTYCVVNSNVMLMFIFKRGNCATSTVRLSSPFPVIFKIFNIKFKSTGIVRENSESTSGDPSELVKLQPQLRAGQESTGSFSRQSAGSSLSLQGVFIIYYII